MSLSKQLAITTVTYGPCTLDDALGSIRGAGYSRVEVVCVPGHCDHYEIDMDDAGVEALKARLNAHGLALSCLGAATGLATAGAVEQAKQSIELARKLGTNVVVHSIAGASGHDENLDDFFQHIGGALEKARQNGVIIALELHGNHTGNGRSMLEVIRRVDHPNLKINYDTANCMYHGGQWPYEDLEAALPEVVNIHLKDKIDGKGVWNFPPVGSGQVDFERVFRILDKGDYRGTMSIEIEFDERGFPPLTQIGEAAASSLHHVTGLLAALGH